MHRMQKVYGKEPDNNLSLMTTPLSPRQIKEGISSSRSTTSNSAPLSVLHKDVPRQPQRKKEKLNPTVPTTSKTDITKASSLKEKRAAHQIQLEEV